jgi:Zn-dependent protease
VTIAKVFGIPVRLHWSFFLLMAGFIAYGWFTLGPIGGLLVTIMMVGAFGSVALHELGHAMAARNYGIATEHITLYPFGGVAAIESMPKEPDHEIVIALAGPAVNFALFAVFGLLFSVTDGATGTIIGAMMSVNLIMGLFNLIPAFPMDGGRVLRALLAKRMGWVPASKLAMQIGKAFGWVFLITGVIYRSPSLLMVGGFLFVAIASERRRLVWENYQEETGFTPPWAPDGPEAGKLGCATPAP